MLVARSMAGAGSVLVAVALSACGGGGDSGSAATPTPPAAPVNASPGGIYNGAIQGSTVTLLGIITEAGEFHFIGSDNTQYWGVMAVSGNAGTGTYTGAAEVGTAFLDGATTGTGTISGTVTARSSIAANSTFTSARGTVERTTMSLAFNAVYSRASSLATIAGNYRDPDTNAVINVNSNGVLFSQDAVSGCVINGAISIINATYNAYRVEYSFSSCRAPYTQLNGTTARGLGTLDNTSSPERAVIGVVNGTAGYSIARSFPRI